MFRNCKRVVCLFGPMLFMDEPVNEQQFGSSFERVIVVDKKTKLNNYFDISIAMQI